MKIFAIGMNYALHNQELNGTLEKPLSPVIFLKAETALSQGGQPFSRPNDMGRIDYEAEIVIHFCKTGKDIPQSQANNYYDKVTIGIDFTARDLQAQFKKKGHPWDIAKGFDGSAAIGEWIAKNSLPDIQNLSFHLNIDGKTVQRGHSSDMMYSVDEIISFISHFYTITPGDILYTGTPVGVGPVFPGNHLQGYIEDQKLLDFYVQS